MIDTVVDALSVHRLARLVASDLISAPTRDAIIRSRYAARGDHEARTLVPTAEVDWTRRALEDGPDAPKLAQLIVCKWCSSAWLAVGVVVARRLFPRAWPPVARALAFSSVAGLLGSAERHREPEQP